MVLHDTTGTSSWLSHCNHPMHRSEFQMQRALAVEFDQKDRESERERKREREGERDRDRERDRERDLKQKKIEDVNTLPCRVRVSVNLF